LAEIGDYGDEVDFCSLLGLGSQKKRHLSFFQFFLGSNEIWDIKKKKVNGVQIFYSVIWIDMAIKNP
jgi:hypothetical protein